jgi:hypothetical protein
MIGASRLQKGPDTRDSWRQTGRSSRARAATTCSNTAWLCVPTHYPIQRLRYRLRESARSALAKAPPADLAAWPSLIVEHEFVPRFQSSLHQAVGDHCSMKSAGSTMFCRADLGRPSRRLGGSVAEGVIGSLRGATTVHKLLRLRPGSVGLVSSQSCRPSPNTWRTSSRCRGAHAQGARVPARRLPDFGR